MEKTIRKNKKIMLVVFFCILLAPLLKPGVCTIWEIFTKGFHPFANAWIVSVVNWVDSNKVYYATVVGVGVAIFSFIDKLEQRNETFKNEMKKNQELRYEEIDQYRDNYRPTFIKIKHSTLKLVMKDSSYFIENVYIYNKDCKFEEYLGSLSSGSEISIKLKESYFIIGETLIGEKFIFGEILKGIKIYKALNEGENPILPSDFSGNCDLELERRIWKSFNVTQNNSKVDNIFFYKTRNIREKMALNQSEYMKEIIEARNIKQLLCDTLETISRNKSEFSEKLITSLILTIKKIFQENIDYISINPSKISKDQWEYIDKKINLGKKNKENKVYPASRFVEPYTDFNQHETTDIISVCKCLVGRMNIEQEVEKKLTEYKERIVEEIEISL